MSNGAPFVLVRIPEGVDRRALEVDWSDFGGSLQSRVLRKAVVKSPRISVYDLGTEELILIVI